MNDAGNAVVLPLQQLPKPVLARVLFFLPLSLGARLACLCSRFSKAFNDEVAWRERLLRESWPQDVPFPTQDFRAAFRRNLWWVTVSCEHDDYGHVVYASFPMRMHAQTSIPDLLASLASEPRLHPWVARRQVTDVAVRATGAAAAKEPLWSCRKPRPTLGQDCEDRRRLSDVAGAGPECTLVLTLFFRA